jgi:O-acetyl-ADP-ribose deacetylase
MSNSQEIHMTELRILSGDITTLKADVIVCPAHHNLISGRGLSAQIHAKAGPELDEECRKLAKSHAGDVQLTQAYQLPQRYIAHAVTPQWSSGDYWAVVALQQLKQCYQQACELALSVDARSIAFPALGTGCNRVPHSVSAHIGLEILMLYKDRFDTITVCLQSEAIKSAWQQIEHDYPSCHQTIPNQQIEELQTSR